MPARTIWTLVLATTLSQGPSFAKEEAPATPPGRADIDRAIDRGVAWLLDEQEAWGAWGGGDDDRAIGPTSLVTLALLHAGLDETGSRKEDRRLAKALAFLDRSGPGRGSREKDPGTYATSLLLLALRDRGRVEDRPRLQRLADLLVRTQAENGQWGYSGTPGDSGRGGPEVGDNSNSQFAVLALGAANGEGLRVGLATFERARRWWRSCDQADGGFSYSSGGAMYGESSGSMTAAGISSLAILDTVLGPLQEDMVLSRAVHRLRIRFSVEKNFGPATGAAAERQRASGRGWLHYYLWALERAMVLADVEKIADHDWYREGVAHLLASQDDDGSWRQEMPLYATSFALLFLTRAADPPRAFTRPPTDAPTTPSAGAPPVAAAPPPPAGGPLDWLREKATPDVLTARTLAAGPAALKDLVRGLSDADPAVRRAAFEALSLLLEPSVVEGADAHPLRRGRLALWVRRNARFLLVKHGRFVIAP